MLRRIAVVIAIVVYSVACTDSGSSSTTNTSPLVRVPDVVGFDEANARTAVINAGFPVETSVESIDGEPGLVAQQIPSAGSEADASTVVTLVIPPARPTTTTTTRVPRTTTTVDPYEEIVERIRRIDAAIFETGGIPTFIRGLTDTQIRERVSRLCVHMGAFGVENQYERMGGDVPLDRSSLGSVHDLALAAMMGVLVEEECPDLFDEYDEFYDALTG